MSTTPSKRFRRAGDQVTCPCASRYPLKPAHHDWLLSFEERGLTGVMKVIDHFAFTSDGGPLPGELGWADFVGFVNAHDWANPYSVARLAQFVDEAIRHRIEAKARLEIHSSTVLDGDDHRAGLGDLTDTVTAFAPPPPPVALEHRVTGSGLIALASGGDASAPEKAPALPPATVAALRRAVEANRPPYPTD